MVIVVVAVVGVVQLIHHIYHTCHITQSGAKQNTIKQLKSMYMYVFQMLEHGQVTMVNNITSRGHVYSSIHDY